MIDSNGGSEQEGRSQPEVAPLFTVTAPLSLKSMPATRVPPDDYLQWNRNALMLTPLVLEIIAEKAA
jgi:hypothetical protein